MPDEILAGVIGGIAGAVSGALLGYFSARAANSSNRAGVRLDARLDAVDSCLESLTRESIAYWRSSGRDAAAESKIKGHFEDLGVRIHNLGGFGIPSSVIEAAQTIGDELNTLVTGDYFETDDRVANDAILQSIRDLAANIAREFHPHRRG